MFSFGKKIAVGKLIRQSFALLLFLALLVWINLSLKQNQTFPIKKIQVVATLEHLDPKVLRNTIQPYIGDGFFGLAAAMLSERLMHLPWVRSVSIQRVWPDQIIVSLEEQKAIAEWNGASLINDAAEIFTPDKNTFPQNLPQLTGPDIDVKMILQNYFQMNKILQPLQSFIAQLEVDPHRAWRLILSDGTSILLGYENMLARLQLLAKAYPQIFKTPNKTAKVIDLRYSNGFAIKWDEIKKI